MQFINYPLRMSRPNVLSETKYSSNVNDNLQYNVVLKNLFTIYQLNTTCVSDSAKYVTSFRCFYRCIYYVKVIMHK